MTDTMTYWRGKPITGLSREELIEVVEFLGGQLRCLTTARAIEERALGKVALLKKGYSHASQN